MQNGFEKGSLLDDRYRVESVIGKGGYGVVYRALQVSTQQLVAIKVLLTAPASDKDGYETERARFEREMQLIAKLRHPNIVRLIDTGTLPSGQMYTVLEYIEGMDLATLLRTDGALKPAEAKTLMFQVLDALAVAHGQGIIHRDLKPRNIMVTTTGYRRNAMVLDFGISGIVEDFRGEDYETLTGTNTIQGTPVYMAPEQLRAESPRAETDIYAWGLVLNECLHGRRTVSASSLADVIAEQVLGGATPLSKEVAEHPLGAVIRRATEKNYEDRFASAAEALEALEAFHIPKDFVLPWTGRKATDVEATSADIPTVTRTAIPTRREQGTGPAVAKLETLDGLAVEPSLDDETSVDMRPPAPRRGHGRGRMISAVAAVVTIIAAVVVVVFVARVGDEETQHSTTTDPTQASNQDTGSSAPSQSKHTVDAPGTAAPARGQDNPLTARERGSYVAGESVTLENTRGESVFIAGGGSVVGSPAPDAMIELCRTALRDLADLCTPELFANQQPARDVEVAPFFIDKLEVSRDAYMSCAQAGACAAPRLEACAFLDDDGGFSKLPNSARDAAQASSLQQSGVPAVCVTQAEANDYCEWAGKRLPSEHEWEVAASAAGTRLFPWGNSDEQGGTRANGAELSLIEAMGWSHRPRVAFRQGALNTDRAPFLRMGGAYPDGASREGVLDLAGNAREWTAGPYVPYDGEGDASRAVVRGGGWADVGPWLSAKVRDPLPQDTRRADLGFRCAVSPPEQAH